MQLPRVAFSSRKRMSPIRMVFSNNEVQLSAGSADESQAHGELIDPQLDGEAITVALILPI